ncbi:MAG: site-specific integrase [Planctomycetes bacterium]|nr:site-specific integrase [Planctomycetota bacterium]
MTNSLSSAWRISATRKTAGNSAKVVVGDRAILLVLLNTAMRVSEALALELKQYQQQAFHNIRRKGKKVTRKLRVPKPARDALDEYIDQVRGRRPRPLFQSKSGRRRVEEDDLGHRRDLIAAIRNGSVVTWQHINLHGEYDFSDEKLKDSVGLRVPKILELSVV